MAQLDRSGLKAKAASLFPDNTSGDISPMDIRAVFQDMFDSFALKTEAALPSASYILGAIAGRIPYNSITGRPSLFSGRYADLSGKPILFSGAFADLSGRPAGNAYVPLNGTTGYVLTKTAAGRAWERLPYLIRAMTQAEYDALTDKDSNTIYFTRDV